jgi:hypothetical protein
MSAKAFITFVVASVFIAAIPVRAQPTQAPPIAGLHEAVFGVPNLQAAIDYWRLFGFHVVADGVVPPSLAGKLYNVSSAARAVRMQHLDTDQGYVRLWQWDKPAGEGVGLVPLLTPGTRWVNSFTDDLISIYNEAEEAKLFGDPVEIIAPVIDPYASKDNRRPMFFNTFQGVREMVVLTPVYRRVFYQLFNLVRPNLGQIAPTRHRTSQIVIAGMTVAGDDGSWSTFYADVLRLPRWRDEFESTYQAANHLARDIYQLKPESRYYSANFRNPLDVGVKIEMHRGGSLYVRRIPTALAKTNLIENSRPGHIGLTLFTYRVSDIKDYHARVRASSATKVSAIIKNEFGELSFSFRAPDGMDWVLVGR